jgi:2-polyprenyl-3-methyl-5-hydroxy-6-metoxy-1,4-benzoquinol methylase
MREEYNTLEFYNKNAEEYFNQTIVGDVQENYDRFLKNLPSNAYILDFGCGSGRDSKYFIENGYRVKAIDGSIEMCKLASIYINQEVECMRFDQLNDVDIYEGIWACSSILHVEEEQLPIILTKMIHSLKKDGIIYTAFKKGTGHEIKEGKYYKYLTKEELENTLSNLEVKAQIIDYFETLPSTKRVSNAIWANFIIRKC